MKVAIAGNAVVFTSAMALKDLETIKKYRPDALKLMGGKDNKETLFSIDVAKTGCGGIGQFGAIFANATHDDAKLACITICMNGEGMEDISGFVADKYGAAWQMVNKLEETLPGVLTEVNANRKALIDSITTI